MKAGQNHYFFHRVIQIILQVSSLFAIPCHLQQESLPCSVDPDLEDLGFDTVQQVASKPFLQG